MLSAPLFRDGDTVHRRSDLQIEWTYGMLHNSELVALTEARFNAMGDACELFVYPENGVDRGVCYETVDGWFVSDEMFVEGNRIMRYIAP